jgi:hypothetical protein
MKMFKVVPFLSAITLCASMLCSEANAEKAISVQSASIDKHTVKLKQRSDDIQDTLMPYMISDDSGSFQVGGKLTAVYAWKGKKWKIVYGPNAQRGNMGTYEVSKIYKLAP